MANILNTNPRQGRQRITPYSTCGHQRMARHATGAQAGPLIDDK